MVSSATRPTPIWLWRQTAVGPVAVRNPMTIKAVAAGAGSASRREPLRREVTNAAAERASKSAATARQQPGAERIGRSPKPPARDPTIAPAVLAT